MYRSIPQRSHAVSFECGIFISPEEPYLAATPVHVCYDATVTIPREIIEVKCPFNAVDITPEEAAKKIKNFMSTYKVLIRTMWLSHKGWLQVYKCCYYQKDVIGTFQ